jgi:hypothetical protein
MVRLPGGFIKRTGVVRLSKSSQFGSSVRVFPRKLLDEAFGFDFRFRSRSEPGGAVKDPGEDGAQRGQDRPWAYSLVLAGGGIAGGICLGAADAIAAYVTRDPNGPADLAATVYHLLGVPPATTIRDRLGEPHARVVGKPIDALLA